MFNELQPLRVTAKAKIRQRVEIFWCTRVVEHKACEVWSPRSVEVRLAHPTTMTERRGYSKPRTDSIAWR